MKVETIRGTISVMTIVMCSLWIGTFSFTLGAAANEAIAYDLTVTVVSEHGTAEPNSGSYSAGTVVTLTATPETGYMVRQWTGTDDDTSCALTNTVTMDSDKTVTVEFGPRNIIKVPVEYNTIQEAIDAAGCGDMVILSSGVYFEDINFHGKNIIVTSMNPDDPDVVARTIIQGSGAGPVVTFSGGENQSCVLDGLTITSNYAGNAHGIYCSGSSPTIINCTISRNSGDGVYCRDASSPYLINSTISDNIGCGVKCYSYGNDVNLTNCTITGNGAEGIWSWDANPILTNCIVFENVSGPFTLLSAYPEVTYSCIDSNEIWPGIGNINDNPLFCGWGSMPEVYVDSSNPSPGDGTQGNPFSDLKSAVDYDLALSNQSPCLGTGKGGVNMGADMGVCNGAGPPARIIHVASGVYSVTGLSLAHNVSVYGAGEQVTVVEGTLFGLRTDTVVSNLKVTKGTLEGIRVGSDETPEILQCIISDNKGGVFCSEGSSPNLTNCTIKSNNGRGVYCAQWASPNLTGCMIMDNNSSGLSSEYWCSPTLTNCTISGNSAIAGGGIFFSKIGYPILTNCKIINNYAEYSGGGVALNESCYPTLINCTIAGNWGGIGGGLSLDWDCAPVLTNCILWGNSDNSGSGEAAQIQNTTMGTPVINYCCLQGWTGSLGGIGNIGDNPLFVDVANDNYHLMAGSPCINMGDNSVIQPSVLTDLDGKPRIVNGKVDMGVYEYQDFQTLYVDADAPPGGDGKSWITAFRHLQDALFNVIHPSEIRVAQGIYKPHLNTYSAAPPSRTDTFQLKNGVTIKGGYAGLGQPDPDARDIILYDTILSGDMNGDDIDVNDPSDLRTEPSRSDNNYHVLTGNGTVASAILDGFTITGGLANGASNEQHRGGGMTNMNGSPTVMNCTFRANAAANGGGLFCLEGTSILSNCGFEDNYGWASGGGIYNSSVHMRLNECTFIGNVAIWGGGGMISHGPITLSNCVFNSNSSPGGNGGGMANDGLIYTMANCTFSNNSAERGGGIWNIDCGDGTEDIPTVTDCTFSGNSATEDGGAIFNSFSTPTITNCIFKDNSANRMGGVIYNEDNSESYLTTCTFSNNSSNQHGGAIYIRDAFSGTFTDSIFENNTAAGRGGAILHTGFGELDVIRCEFRDGSAERGGAIYNIYASLLLSQCILVGNQAEYAGAIDTDGDITLANCLLVNNQAVVWGGALSNMENTSRSVNCTFVGNSANYGGAIFSNIECDTTAINSIFWNNTAQTGSQIATTGEHGSSTLTIHNCDIEHLLDGLHVPTGCTLIWGEGNINNDPLFTDSNNGNYRLSVGSPCIDTGVNWAILPLGQTDLDGKPRIIGDVVDMGTYEFWGPIYVDDDGPNDPGPGDPQISDPLENGSEDHPFDTIQEAINVSVDWYQVLVRQGSYFEPGNGKSIDFLGKNITLTSTDPTDWDVVDSTVILGYVQFNGTEDPNCKFTGFTIRNIEGAIYGGNHTHATISHCNISGNGPCGATVIKDCDGTISNCLITDNTTFFRCGVFPVILGCNGVIKNCTIANNDSGLSVGTATIENCIIQNNIGSQLGVGIGETLNISYCNLQGGLEGITGGGSVNWGPGNIDTDPCFIRLGFWLMDDMTLIEGDYHLRSEGWCWSTDSNSWTYDYATSRCIDAGNPASDLGDELMSLPRDPNNVWGVNLRINMGAYGGTGQAGMPPHGWALVPDLNNDGIVNFLDCAYQTLDWQVTAPEQPGDQNRDGVVNKIDLAALGEKWLQVTVWCEY